MIDTTQLGSLPVDAKRELLRNLLAAARRRHHGPLPALARPAGAVVRLPDGPGEPGVQLPVRRAPAARHRPRRAWRGRSPPCRAGTRRSARASSCTRASRSRSSTRASTLEIPRIDAADWTWDELREHLEQRGDAPFDLARGPSLRVEFYERPDEVVLLLVFHHLVADLWSMDLLIEELHHPLRRRGQGHARRPRRRSTPPRWPTSCAGS